MRSLLVLLLGLLACTHEDGGGMTLDRPMGYLSDVGTQPKRIIVICGQSNAAGRKFIEQVAEPQKTLLQSDFDNVLLREWEATNADPPVVMYDTRTQAGTQTPVRDDGPLAPRPYALPTPNLGFELSLGHYLDGITHGWIIVKYAIGGTSLAVNWDPAGTYPDPSPNLFDGLVEYMGQAEAELGGYVAAVVWSQGENDALNATDAANYEANLTAFIAALRGSAPHWANLPFIFNRLSSSNSGAHKAAVRTGQANVAANVAGTVMVDVDDLVPLDGGQHFIPNAYVTLGYRFGPAVLFGLGMHIELEPAFTYQAQDRSADFFDASTNPNLNGTIVGWHWDFGDGNTSTSQNPSHTYSADGSYRVVLIATDADGFSAQASEEITIAAPSGWTVDATSGHSFPVGSSEWTAFLTAHNMLASFGVPTNDWDMQDSGTGALVDAIGSKNLTTGNSPTRQKSTGGTFTRKAIGASGAATTQSASNTSLENLNANSWLVMAVLKFNQSPSINRSQLAGAASSVNDLQAPGGANGARKRTGSKAGATTASHVDAYHIYFLKYDLARGEDNLYTDLELLELQYVAGAAGTSLIATFSNSGDVTLYTDIVKIVRWKGAAAERAEEEIRHMGSALGWLMQAY